MKRLGVFLLPLDGMLVRRRNTPSIKFVGTHLYTWVGRGTVRVTCLAQEPNTMSPARARSPTTRSGDKRTNHLSTVTANSGFKWTKQYRQKTVMKNYKVDIKIPSNRSAQVSLIGLWITRPLLPSNCTQFISPQPNKLGKSHLQSYDRYLLKTNSNWNSWFICMRKSI